MLSPEIIARAVAQFGTPLFLYDQAAIEARIQELRSALPQSISLYYAVKANPNVAILAKLRPLVDGLDISSGGELKQSLLAGYAPTHLSFAGPGKTEQELTLAIEHMIGSISIESRSDMERIAAISAQKKICTRVLLRVNPSKIIHKFAVKMGGKATQFGVDEEEASSLITDIRNNPHLQLIGMHIFSGTQCLDAPSLLENIEYILHLAEHYTNTYKLPLTALNLGGGFGIAYFENEQPLDLKTFSTRVTELIHAFEARTGCKPRYMLELGRYIIGESGCYVTRIVNIKHSKGIDFYILDGGMHHHLAASGNLGQIIKKNYHIVNISRATSELKKVTVCGPLCTPLDTLAQNISLPVSAIGDILVFYNSGAYAYTSSPLLFLGHETPQEVLWNHDSFELIRKSFDITDFN